jgi:HD superfamily phosphohydrolase
MKQFCEQSDLEYLRKIVIPPMNEIKEVMKEHQRLMEESKRIIRRFDEVLSQKASRLDLDRLDYIVRSCIKNDSFQELIQK